LHHMHQSDRWLDAFYAIVEFVLIVLIVWHAWKWPLREA
jgi:hypothetical protein